MPTRLLINETLLASVSRLCVAIPTLARLDAVVGRLRATGYFALRPHLERVPKLRILVGIDVDAHLAHHHRQGLLFHGDPAQTIAEVEAALRSDIKSAPYLRDVEAGVRTFVADVASRRVELRAHPSRRLAAKMCVFVPEAHGVDCPGAVLTGSSDLAAVGLPVIVRRFDLDVLLHDHEDVRLAAEEFERLWQESTQLVPEVITRVAGASHLREDITPFELYIKLLSEYFGPAIEHDPGSETDLPRGIRSLAYQTDAVTDGWLKLQRHGGFFLADVVGLGKTVVAARIARKFFYHNGFPSHRSRLLVITPPGLRDNWEETFERFGLDDCVRVVGNGSLHKIRDPEKYDLVIVDEAHKFRNDTADGYALLQRLCKTPTRRRLPDRSLAPKKVILVSATPLNNRPEDIRNLVLLFQDGRDSTVIGNLQHFFAQRVKEYALARKLADPDESGRAVARIYDSIREKIVQPLTVRRTRTDLMLDHRYRADLEANGVHFPTVAKPQPIFYRLDRALEQLYDHTITVLAGVEPHGLTYNRYRAIAFLRPALRGRYHNAELISTQLAYLMKTLLVKRIDSSFHAFVHSLRRFHAANEAMLRMLARGAIYIAPNINVADLILDDREDELLDAIAGTLETDPTITICEPADFEAGFAAGIARDAEVLRTLLAAWEAVDGDPKLAEFLRRLDTELLAREVNETGKLVIFSEARETTEHLASALTSRGYGPVLTVDSQSRKRLASAVRANFDANLPLGERRDEYRILISTEVLAEGINLHRAHIIVNYDTPWNSTRLMQRIGRVNRIGSTAGTIRVYNFYPTAQVDSDIDLRRKAFLKLQAFHVALGEDSQVYSPDENVGSFGLFDREIEEPRDERLAFLSELRDFRDASPDAFRRIQGLPLRSRCGRSDAAAAGQTLVFVRNDRRDAFYRISDRTEEISFVEAARRFWAPADEAAVPLSDAHHAHVGTALTDFRTRLEVEAVRDRAVEQTLGPNEQKAMRLLAAAHNGADVGADDRALLTAAQQAIKRARFQELPRQLNALQRSVKAKRVTAAVFHDKLMEILRAYPLTEPGPPVPDVEADADVVEPTIVLSESFAGLAVAAATSAAATTTPDGLLGCLEKTIKFGPGWEDPLPPDDWEVLK